MKKEMLINVLQPEECRIAILEDGVLEELYVERTSHESYVGNIYKGRIVNIEPSIQAAFVDFGVGRNGFLHVSDVEPTYYRHLEPRRESGYRVTGRDRFRAPARERDSDVLPETEAGSDAPDAPDRTDEPRREERRGRGRRRGHREGGRSRRPRRSEETQTPAEGFTPDPEHTDIDRSLPEEEHPRDEFMDSAERRTDDETPPISGHDISDDDIFFPKEPSEAPRSRPPIREEPAYEPAATEEPHITEEPPSEVEWEADMGESHYGAGEVEAAHAPVETLAEEEPRRPERGRRFRDDRGRGRRPMRGRNGLGRPKPLIQDIFKRGQEVLVQVIKEGIGTKGPTLSTYISIAGRYLVLMPGLNRIGVSRKIADEEQRRRLRDILGELEPPRGIGFIIRTAGLDKNKKELQRDLAYLARLWQVVVRRIKKLKSPAEIYQESDMITRTIRDTFTGEIDSIVVDEAAAFEHAQEFLQIVMPRYASRIHHYSEPEPLFHRYGIEDEIARIQQRHVPLPNGGSIVIDQTEALVAIDVNSGNFRADNNAEETAYQMNLHAAREIARQLRLRDLGGVIVNDFIDMRDEKHRRGVERALREAVRRDRARTKILRISAFGLIEMTRQRIRPSLKRSVYQDCQHCHGAGQVKTCESMSIDVMRMIQLAAHREDIHRILIAVSEDVSHYLLNKKRREISRLEESGSIHVTITGVARSSPEKLEFVCYDKNNNEVKFLPPEENGNGSRRR
jgi:ribonuclease E